MNWETRFACASLCSVLSPPREACADCRAGGTHRAGRVLLKDKARLLEELFLFGYSLHVSTYLCRL